jgi:hypothetical protein
VALNEEILKICGTKILIGGWKELNEFFNVMRVVDLIICQKLTTALQQASLSFIIASMSAKRCIPPLKKSMYSSTPQRR